MPETTQKNRFNLRISERKISPTLRVNEMARSMQAEGKKVFHLGFGESQIPVPDWLVETLKKHAHEVSYLPVQGLPGLREAVARDYTQSTGIKVSAEQIIITPGSKAALYLAINLIEGDVLLPRPSWVSYAPQAMYSGKKVFWFNTADDLQHIITEAKQQGGNPILLVLNSPNNPSGHSFIESELKAFAKTARDNNLVVLSDEIYGKLCTQQPYASIASHYPEGSIITTGLSKDAGLGGWRLGWAIVPAGEAGADMLSVFKGFASELWSSPASPIQYAAIDILQHPELKQFTADSAQFHAARTEVLYNELSKLNLSMPKPSGGYYVYPSFNAYRNQLEKIGITTSEQLQDYLLEKYQIATLAGSAFGDTPENLCLRLSSTFMDCLPEENAQQLWQAFLNTNNRDGFVAAQTHPELFTVIKRFGEFTKSL